MHLSSADKVKTHLNQFLNDYTMIKLDYEVFILFNALCKCKECKQ